MTDVGTEQKPVVDYLAPFDTFQAYGIRGGTIYRDRFRPQFAGQGLLQPPHRTHATQRSLCCMTVARYPRHGDSCDWRHGIRMHANGSAEPVVMEDV